MASVPVATELVYVPRERFVKRKSDYDINLWREVKKRWMVFGVLLSLLAAVTSFHAGAPGGPLHTEYLRYLPLSYIYFTAARAPRSASPRARLYLLTILHAHVVVPALCVVTVDAFVGVDQRIVRGAILWSCGGGNGWLSVSLHPRPPAPRLAALVWAASLVSRPIYMYVMCNRATIPPLGHILATVLTTLTPYSIGVWCGPKCTLKSEVKVKVAALTLLYVESCERLWTAEGALFVPDVLATLLLVLCWQASTICWGMLLQRVGALSTNEVKLLVAVAVPKILDVSWETAVACIPTTLSHLPAVFIAPTQALLLSAYICDDDETDDDDEPIVVISDE